MTAVSLCAVQTNSSGSKQRARGFNDDLDSTCEGIMQTFKRKLEQIEARYPEMAPKVILKKLLGKDVSRDDLGRPGSSSDKSPPPVTALPRKRAILIAICAI